MNFFLVGLLSFGLLTMPALAEPTATPIPAFMQKMMPKDAETRFFGEVKFPTPVHNRYFLHFYEFPQTPLVMSGSDGVDKDYMADLFSRPIGKRQAKYSLVSRLKLDRSYFENEVSKFNFVKAQFMWLVPAKRQGPILRLTCTVTDGFYGPFGEDILFVFDKGFNTKPITNGFYSYGKHNDSVGYDFEQVDAKGFRFIRSRYSALGGEHDKFTDLIWNGKGFYAVSTPMPTPFPPQ